MAVDMLAMTLLSVAMLVSTSRAQDSPRNVAVNKTASQSSTFDGTDPWATPHLTYRASAGLAVDGAPTKSYLDKTCAVTDWINYPQCTDNPWWQVDLGGQYDVFNVTIYQRGEREPGKENYGPLVVHIGDHVERPENRNKYTDRPVVSLPLFPPMMASTVNISITGCGILILCEVEVFAVRHMDKCAINPCQHGGTCADGLLNYTCTCASGYTGVSCETDIDECGSSPCQRGAKCENLVGRFKCDCPPGYNGTRCETDINECARSPCQHGNCADGVNSYSCTCLPGYTGLDCSQDVDECASNPCLEGATCHNYLNFYNCTCAAGFTGQNCETNIDDCASLPCLHNASCKDGVNSYNCKCAAGYTSSNCSDACSGGYYGPGCNSTCSLHCLESSDRGGQHCHHTSGQCLLQTGCKDDFQGARCDMKQPQDNAPIIGGVIAACVVLIIVIVILVVWYRRKQPKKKSSPNFEQDVPDKLHEDLPEEEEEELEEVLATSGDTGDYYNTAGTRASTSISPEQLLDLVAACRKNPDHLKEEYMRLPQGLLHPRDVAMNAHNKGKNRYKNICAYDHSRVVLSILPEDTHSDYINACYVDGYNAHDVFIASQGPTTVNEKDFIRMIWEKDIQTIAMVTKPNEMGKMKCVQYWSDTEEVKFGKFKVKVDSIREIKDITIQRLTIKPSDGAAKQVTHFLYKAWPDKDVPDSPWSLIDFRDKVMTSHTGSSPVLVHCSAGIGRTGTLIALDTALRQLEEEGVLDVFNIVLQIRQQRVGLVQTQAQYTFLHEAALVGLCSAGRAVPLEAFTFDPVANNKTLTEAEFQALERCSTAFSAEDLSLATAEEALYDNRDPDILPPNDSIVWLQNEVEGCSFYINAVFMPSYTEEKRYIVTQTPLPSTVVNFWRAVLENDVKVIVTLDQTEPDLEAGVGVYVPMGETPLTLGPLTLTPMQTEKKHIYTLHTIDVTMGKEKPRRVLQFVVHSWPDSKEVPSDPRQMVSVARAVLDCTPPQQGVILLHCRDGARRSGLLCALLALLERCDSDREVAVPYVVGVLKSIRPQAVHTQEQYAFLYSAMLSHVNSSQVYENVPGPKAKSGGVANGDSVYSN